MREASLLPAWALLVAACSGGPRSSAEPAPAPAPIEQRVILGATCSVADWVLTADCEVTVQGKPALLARGEWVRVRPDDSPLEVPLARPLSLQVGGRDIVFVGRLGLHPSGEVAWGQLAAEIDVTTAVGVLRVADARFGVTIGFLPDGAVESLRLAAPVELQVGGARVLATGEVELDRAGRPTSLGLGRDVTLAGVAFRQYATVDLEWDESGRLSSARERPRLER